MTSRTRIRAPNSSTPGALARNLLSCLVIDVVAFEEAVDLVAGFKAEKCARGQGHPVAVLAVGYPGGVIRQISFPQPQVPYVRCCLANYRKLKAALEKICELNQQLVRGPEAPTKTWRPK